MTASFSFATKAATLERLTRHVTQGRLCDQVIVRAPAWAADRAAVLDQIAERFGAASLVVRSSAAAEDGWDGSLAGAHLSIVDVTPSAAEVADAVDRVFASYRRTSPDDEVLVQPMVQGVVLSGVVLTRDLDTGSPYYVINYDDLTGRTDTVTGGRVSTTVLVHRARTDKVRSPRIRKLVACVIELEAITGVEELDIEFCITKDEDVYILQVRPLAARGRWASLPDAAVDRAIDDIRTAVGRYMRPHPGLAGESTIFAEMTDWNPAEMIGNAPRPLALSLYKTLITDGVWAEARARMGYRRVEGPLLVDFHGRPFIDVRKSFNSFLPAGFAGQAADRLVNHQLARLRDNRDLHDKVEFEIAVTCRDFTFDSARRRLAEAGIGADDIARLEQSLGALTDAALAAGVDGISALVAQANRLLAPRQGFEALSHQERARRLLDDCRALGTLPFSQLARHAFIGVAFLKSLVARAALTEDDMAEFMRGIRTVATDMARDMYRVATGGMPTKDFLRRYGHLRPGTYDILSWRYDEKPDVYLGHMGHEPTPAEAVPALPATKRQTIDKLLGAHGYGVSADQLLAYIAAAVKAREQAKFAFTRAISDALSSLVAWGEAHGLDRDELSFLPIEALLGAGPAPAFGDMIAAARERFTETRAIRLPHVILDLDDIDVVRLPLGRPTFITNTSVTATTRQLSSKERPDIDGHILLIESADPGFDWIFSHDIRGLITKYGGANSHMAIRCAEFQLPAAIGCGERLFETLCKASVVELNCAARKVTGH